MFGVVITCLSKRDTAKVDWTDDFDFIIVEVVDRYEYS